jgi:hypothetical protein
MRWSDLGMFVLGIAAARAGPLWWYRSRDRAFLERYPDFVATVAAMPLADELPEIPVEAADEAIRMARRLVGEREAAERPQHA